MSDVNIAGHW